MGDLGRIVLGAGLQDGCNPCIMLTCAVFILHGMWVSKSSHKVGRLRVFFVLIYALFSLIFNFSVVQIFLFQKDFVFAAKIIYFVLGFLAFILGILFLKDWFLLSRRQSIENFTSEKIKPDVTGVIGMYLTTFVLAVVLSALATLWPVNNYVMLLGNEAILSGQWQMVMVLLVGYAFCMMWPLWFLWLFLGIRNLRPTLLKIVSASVFFTASSSMILIFK